MCFTMTDEQNKLLNWEDLPLKVRRNRKHMYNYLKSVLSPEDDNPDDEE